MKLEKIYLNTDFKKLNMKEPNMNIRQKIQI